MELGYREIEELFGVRHGILDDRRVAFRGRLDHLRKLGCPAGVNTGKGRPAIFGWKQILSLGLALDFVDLGFTPENTAHLVNDNAIPLHLEVKRLVSGIDRSAIVDAAQSNKWPTNSSVFVIVHVGALRGLKADGSVRTADIEFQRGGELKRWFELADEYATPVAVMDLGTRIANLLSCVSVWSSMRLDDVVEDFLGWVEQQQSELMDQVLHDLDS